MSRWYVWFALNEPNELDWLRNGKAIAELCVGCCCTAPQFKKKIPPHALSCARIIAENAGKLREDNTSVWARFHIININGTRHMARLDAMYIVHCTHRLNSLLIRRRPTQPIHVSYVTHWWHWSQILRCISALMLRTVLWNGRDSSPRFPLASVLLQF